MSVFIDNSADITRRLKNAIKAAYTDIGKAVTDHARDNVVVNTGVLRDSIRFETHEDYVTIGSDSEYSSYVELGTGPNYTIPPEWEKNIAQRGHHVDEPWRYFDDRDGEWHIGGFVTARPYLRPAVLDNVAELQRIFEDHLRNA